MSDPSSKPDSIVRPVEEDQTAAISGKAWIHYDPDRVDYAINDQELSELESASGNVWKDICLVSFGVGLPTLINAITIAKGPLPKSQEKFIPDMPFVINLFLGLIGLGFALGFGIAWRKTAKKVKTVTDRIRQKPKISLN